MKKILFFLLLILVSVFATLPDKITIVPFEYKDFTNTGEPTFNVSMRMDCVSNKIMANVSSNNQPISGVLTFLKYVQYDNQLLSTQTTDGSGSASYQLTGNITFRTGIFVLVMEKSGYAKREAHFYITDCFKNVSAPPIPPPPPIPPQQNTTPPANTTLPLPPSPPVQNQTQTNLTNNTTSPIVPLPNATTNGGNTTGTNASNNGSSGSGNSGPCPIGFILLLFPCVAASLLSSGN